MQLWFLVFTLGCPRSDPETGPVAVDRIDFGAAGEAVVSFPITSFELGVPAARDEDDASYLPSYATELGTRWHVPTKAVRTGDTIELHYPGDLVATVTLTEQTPHRWALTWLPPTGAGVGFFRVTAVGDPTEGYYGLGETFDHPHHRGQIRDMHLEPSGDTESGYNEVHVPIPMVLGTSGWGWFIADDHPMRFEVATEADDQVRMTVGTGIMSDLGLRMHVFVEEHPLDLTRHYYELTGYPALPAPWALGPIFWRNDTTGQDEVEADMRTMRDLDIPVNALWIDRPYATAVNSFDFATPDYHDPDAMITTGNALGYRMALWHTPYAEEATGSLHQEAIDNQYFPPLEPDIVLQVVNWGPLVDFTNPEARSWWTGLVRRHTDQGIEGFKLDFAEDIVPGFLQYRLPWVFADGSDERTMHRQYQRLYHQVYRDALGEGEGFLLCRTGAWGDQVNGTIIWPGDIDGNLAVHGEDLGDYVAVGGLPAAVVASVGLGPSGFPFFGSDTGGYRHTPPNKETYTRWFEHTALSSVMQIGMGSSDVAWNYVLDWDDAMLADYRDYSRLHLRLFPYLWTYAERIAETGHPLQRPLGLAHPELGEHFDFDYLLGEALLVAPVVRPGATTRRVVLPAGDWVDWFDGDVRSGGEHTVEAPLSKIPLFLKRGGMVPMLRPTIDTLSPVANPAEIESFDADPGVLWVRVFPGDASSFELYDGTTLTQEATANGATLGYQAGSVFTQGVVFEVMGLGGAIVEVSLPANGTVNTP